MMKRTCIGDQGNLKVHQMIVINDLVKLLQFFKAAQLGLSLKIVFKTKELRPKTFLL